MCSLIQGKKFRREIVHEKMKRQNVEDKLSYVELAII